MPEDKQHTPRVFTLRVTADQVQSLYLTLSRREEKAYGWMEQPLVDVELALEPLHRAIHDRQFNAMNRQFFGDDSRRLPEAELSTVADAATPAPQPAMPEPVATITTWHKNRRQHAEPFGWDNGVEDLPDGSHDLYTAEAITALAEARCAQMVEALEKIDIKAEAGLCYMTLGSAREFLKDVREIANKLLGREYKR